MEEEKAFYEVKERIAVLSQSDDTHSKELNLISFKGEDPKYDIRSWLRRPDKERMYKGVTLTREELKALKDVLNAMEDL